MNAVFDETDTCEGVFNYLAPATQPSLWRNGRVLIERDPDGNTARSQGIETEPRSMPVYDARRFEDQTRRTCDNNGFELLTRPLGPVAIDFTDHTDVVNHYYRHCADIVAEATGARALAFDHNVRSASGNRDGQRITGGQHVQPPAHIVHGDYTLRAAPDRIHQLAEPPSGNDTLSGFLKPGTSLIAQHDADRVLRADGRFAIINVWRNISPQPVAMHPLALCDSQTVRPEDLVVFEIHYPNRIGENYFATYSERHRMYFYPGMTRDEALLIKQWDSAGTLARSAGLRADSEDRDAPCTFSFHSAFAQPQTPPNAPDRWSIEVRCLVLYD